jgi:hypothetical protein
MKPTKVVCVAISEELYTKIKSILKKENITCKEYFKCLLEEDIQAREVIENIKHTA